MELEGPLSLAAIGAGCTTVVLATILATLVFKSKKQKGTNKKEEIPKVDPDKLDKEVYPGGHLTVYYGSQTGTAESFAQQIEREGEQNGMKVHVVDLEDLAATEAITGDENNIDPREVLLKSTRKDENGVSRAIFLMATYGEGEPTDNAVAFMRLLRAKAGLGGDDATTMMMSTPVEEKKEDQMDPTYLAGLDYAVFGLGNVQYEHYNFIGKMTDNALSKVGGRRIVEIGLGNDDDDLDADFETWKDNVMWPALRKTYHIPSEPAAPVAASERLPECPFKIEFLPEGTPAKPSKVADSEIHSSGRHYFTAVDCPVMLTRELRTPLDGGSTVHMEIDISKSKELRYCTADNLGVLSVNDPAVVESVGKALGYDLDAVIDLKPNDNMEWHGLLFPTPCTVRDCLARYCDLTGAMRRSELKLLAAYATDDLDRSALLRMSSKEGKKEFHQKILDAHVGIADVVTKLCKSVKPPLAHFISACPRLQPRYYTISSSSSVHPTSVHITVAVTKTVKNGTVFKGVCSNYLAGLQKNDLVRVFVRDSTFRLPSSPSTPILMVGPGTGIAPMRALLQERAHQKRVGRAQVGENILYFGCKNRKHDYIYESELDGFCKKGILNKRYLAFSREQSEKLYVQHLLANNSQETWDFMENHNGYIYVCGGVKMGHDVSEALKQIIVEQGKLSISEAANYLSQMHSAGRFVQELWA